MTDQLIASRYRVVRELGRGGMGVVYLVEHLRTGDQLALKLLYGQGARNAQVIERFKREARASARIKSEHIVKVVDADVAPELEGAPFLVMELLNGTDLQKQIEKSGRLPPDQALHYLAQAARALDKSHQMGIVHRDLKPENLFIHHREDGTTILKILDFGISKIIGTEMTGDMTGAGMTSTGSVMGTPLYMSPEQARGRVSDIGPTTDVWAMGLIVLQLLTGEVYWRANTVAELMSHILAEPLYPPSERWAWMPPAMDAWFARSCARDPKKRFASVGEQIRALGEALGESSGLSALPEPADPPARIESTSALPPGIGHTATAFIPAPTGGQRTTTSAVAGDATQGSQRPRSRAPLLVGAAVLVLGGVGVTAWAVRPHGSGPGPDPTTTATTTTVTATATSTAGPTPPPTASTATTVVEQPLAVPDAGATVAVATKDAGPAVQQHQGGHTHIPTGHATATSGPMSTTPAAQGTATPTSHTFNPAAP